LTDPINEQARNRVRNEIQKPSSLSARRKVLTEQSEKLGDCGLMIAVLVDEKLGAPRFPWKFTLPP
jgi:hypothetical protein